MSDGFYWHLIRKILQVAQIYPLISTENALLFRITSTTDIVRCSGFPSRTLPSVHAAEFVLTAAFSNWRLPVRVCSTVAGFLLKLLKLETDYGRDCKQLLGGGPTLSDQLSLF
jgi:hypothetical protein